jgi:hypothetical protein
LGVQETPSRGDVPSYIQFETTNEFMILRSAYV